MQKLAKLIILQNSEKNIKKVRKNVFFGDFEISVIFGCLVQNNKKLRDFAISSEFQAEIFHLKKSDVNCKLKQIND